MADIPKFVEAPQEPSNPSVTPPIDESFKPLNIHHDGHKSSCKLRCTCRTYLDGECIENAWPSNTSLDKVERIAVADVRQDTMPLCLGCVLRLQDADAGSGEEIEMPEPEDPGLRTGGEATELPSHIPQTSSDLTSPTNGTLDDPKRDGATDVVQSPHALGGTEFYDI
ncbi:hypothetical protein BDP27DRAFT_1363745 [Rhodocollybia butyracea]|uniref:Uncharacterized protein n=1 Tax=Rhodocollybia butyracea TaxID=206335 RepID=A0A9P5U7N4_9AGAR|nr:hypothetical protein BDP27DRAFT_1363745 [Rhodocollybia butyracea]